MDCSLRLRYVDIRSRVLSSQQLLKFTTISGLVAKPFAPIVPLSVLALAGALPDVVFFLLQFFGIETFSLDGSLISRGCFPYSNDYPYSHSLLGMVISGVLPSCI